jgi:hypothetical protein
LTRTEKAHAGILYGNAYCRLGEAEPRIKTFQPQMDADSPGRRPKLQTVTEIQQRDAGLIERG